jgi:hypothetical protein
MSRGIATSAIWTLTAGSGDNLRHALIHHAAASPGSIAPK